MSELNRKVLIVDDEWFIVRGLTAQVEDMGLEVCGSASSADQAIALAQLHRPFLVLMDMRLDGARDGVDASLVIHEKVGSKLIFITGSQDPQTLERIKLDHASAVLIKPVSELQLRATINAVLGPEPSDRPEATPSSAAGASA